MKLGIMGGTFNPIHIGHLILANSALEELELDKVLFMPSKKPPHKDHDDILDETIRCEMVAAAIEDNPLFEMSDIEIKRDKTTYTFDTLTELKDRGDLYFIMGADSFDNLEKWYKYEEIFKLTTIVVGVRKDMYSNELDELKAYYEDKYAARIYILSMPNMEVSSTELRRHFVNNQSIKYFVNDKVIDILENNRDNVVDLWKDS